MSALRWLVTPLAWVFFFLVRSRLWAYRIGLLPSERASLRTIAVGGLEVGGSGKTPVTGYLIGRLQGAGHRVGLLSRGYGRQYQGLAIHRPGETPTWQTLGDEPTMLLEAYPAAAAAVCAKRVLGAAALVSLECDVALLDDGFSHVALQRDVDVVVLRGESPFGTGHMMPRGSLREPVSSLARATVVWLHYRRGAPLAVRQADSGWPACLARCAPRPLVVSESHLRAPRLLASSSSPRSALSKSTPGTPVDSGTSARAPSAVLLVCAIARADDFSADFVREVGWSVAETMAFRDHHRFASADVQRMVARARQLGVKDIAMTAKDAVKLAGLVVAPMVEAEGDEDSAGQLRWWVVEQELVLLRGFDGLKRAFAQQGIGLASPA